MATFACALTFGSAGFRVGVDGCESGNSPEVRARALYAQAFLVRAPYLTPDQSEVVAKLEPVVVASAYRTVADIAYEDLIARRTREREFIRTASVIGRGGAEVFSRARMNASRLMDPSEHKQALVRVVDSFDRGVDRILSAVLFGGAGPDTVTRIAAYRTEISAPPGLVGPQRDEPIVVAKVRHPLPFSPLEEATFKKGSEPPAIIGVDDSVHTVPSSVQTVHTIRAGETISDVLGDAGLSAREADEWIAAAGQAYNINKVFVGQQLSLIVDGPSKQMVGLELEIDSATKLIAEIEDGRVVARRHSLDFERGFRAVTGIVDTSLFEAARAKGVPARVVSSAAEILGWELNFARDLRRGAEFRIVYEELSRPGEAEKQSGRVLAIEVRNKDQVHEGFWYDNGDYGKRGYYDRNGEALSRYFLRYPVAFSRISSQFNRNRFHPVTKRRQPHYGVDFAAATGTPVRAVANGQVLQSGWYGGNGRFVKLRHNGIYQSGYSHLSRIAKGVDSGKSVKKGQIIGYVGSTGLATGPHLHFSLYQYGKYVDPLNAKLPRADSLTGKALAAHKTNLLLIDQAYARADQNPDGTAAMISLLDASAAPATSATIADSEPLSASAEN